MRLRCDGLQRFGRIGDRPSGAWDRAGQPGVTAGLDMGGVRHGRASARCATRALRQLARPADGMHDRAGPRRRGRHLAIPIYSQLVDPAAIRAAYPGCPIVLDLSHISCAPSSAGRSVTRTSWCPVFSEQGADVRRRRLRRDRRLPSSRSGCRGCGPTVGSSTATRERQAVLAPHVEMHGAIIAMSSRRRPAPRPARPAHWQCRRRGAAGRLLLDRLESPASPIIAIPAAWRTGCITAWPSTRMPIRRR